MYAKSGERLPTTSAEKMRGLLARGTVATGCTNVNGKDLSYHLGTTSALTLAGTSCPGADYSHCQPRKSTRIGPRVEHAIGDVVPSQED